MKEKIYTIPVTEVFGEECECPICLLEKRLEEQNIDYFLGPSLMEPDCRIETNENGFCRRHFEQLYNKQENRLGLGLMIDTHMVEQIEKLKKIYQSEIKGVRAPTGSIFTKLLSSKASAESSSNTAAKALEFLNTLEHNCSICKKLDYTMDRYMDVIMYLWSAESDFRKTFESKKGFCMNHFRMLLESSKKYMRPQESAIFIDNLFVMQIENLERIQKDVNWFTKKFDYRYNDAPWGTSKDAIPKSIQKLRSFSDLK